MKLRALKKLRYPRGGTDGVEYGPGEVFEASDRDAKALTLVRAAEPAGASGNKTDMPKATKAMEPVEDEITTLRGQYRTRMGKAPYNGWDAAELRKRMADQQGGESRSGEYRRRDMRAEE